MYLTYVRKAIGFQWMTAVVVAIISLFFSGTTDTATNLNAGEVLVSALNISMSDLFGVMLFLAFEAALIFFGFCLVITGKHSKLCSSTIIALFFAALWTMQQTIAVPVHGWLPNGEVAFALWFTMMLPVELAVLEILLPPYGFRAARPLVAN